MEEEYKLGHQYNKRFVVI